MPDTEEALFDAFATGVADAGGFLHSAAEAAIREEPQAGEVVAIRG